ncbi:hypothetical protein TREMEDRAFT_65642 [Tremella mesenterica DSM 1558]|uniref:uncharacterized protein n=1 Tax=Tremella mesenterica (strain ATCC 24925 / CBS 8224 / DSM 1558 / NBRC 9311 / NRRL Y-6157 / RJB 2259-6 / UBC 559-6) TaxID=578456 RepID=UPI00032C96B6|nr:uncharacterized protein TREMEDRAFT_65642 [Tremella mesenterica DSM 1558]EIW66363.1 hypothetical protein TREMEDRAFT_65642 [Tremella mesenterica DSM 1558]
MWEQEKFTETLSIQRDGKNPPSFQTAGAETQVYDPAHGGQENGRRRNGISETGTGTDGEGAKEEELPFTLDEGTFAQTIVVCTDPLWGYFALIHDGRPSEQAVAALIMRKIGKWVQEDTQRSLQLTPAS